VTPDGRTLFVANTDDTVTPITAATGTAGRTFRVVPIPGRIWGDAAALALTPDGRTVYVADESQNAVAVISTDALARARSWPNATRTGHSWLRRTAAFSAAPAGSLQAAARPYSAMTAQPLRTAAVHVSDSHPGEQP
jgi:DNA-binding beta-propeller fold protein YncE